MKYLLILLLSLVVGFGQVVTDNVTGLPMIKIGAGASDASALKVARGLVPGQSSVNKFGRNIEIDASITADIWDGGHTLSSGGTSLIWVAPTQARTHVIASTDAGDTAGGAGARTLRVYGLPDDWDSPEVSEDIILDTGSPPVTTNSYVIIQRMYVLTKGATSSNIGIITATATTDGTITAKIRAGQGQTQMIIYGVPSTQTFYMSRLYANMNKASGSATGYVDMELKFNPEPQDELTNFLTKHTFSISLDGTSAFSIPYNLYKSFPGPCILKLQGSSATANMDVSAGFDGILVDN